MLVSTTIVPGRFGAAIGHDLALELRRDRIIDAVVVARAVILRQGRDAAGSRYVIRIAGDALTLIGTRGRAGHERIAFGIAVLGPGIGIVVVRSDIGIAVEAAVPGDRLCGRSGRQENGQKQC